MGELPLDLDDRDDIGFVHEVRRIVTGAVDATAPAEVYIVKIDNWFSSRWVGFSHKALGAVRVAHREKFRIPPFVPNRVVSQAYFTSLKVNGYVAVDAPQMLHVVQTSTDNDHRLVSRHCPRAALFWWSGDSRRQKRGALMAYLPTDDGHTGWYVDLVDHGGWSVALTVGTSRTELERFSR